MLYVLLLAGLLAGPPGLQTTAGSVSVYDAAACVLSVCACLYLEIAGLLSVSPVCSCSQVVACSQLCARICLARSQSSDLSVSIREHTSAYVSIRQHTSASLCAVIATHKVLWSNLIKKYCGPLPNRVGHTPSRSLGDSFA